ncbi:MAG: hypothetical protein A3D35_03000 [Candidatus Staskawiczbacteria bacterium RIFCSPHIGHO2_02_FULL_34_9]|uniref:Uncharacterized protein n=1 Tax=Candidatus Staskawiczbacteria bacterium RIFCSPHIGHO2_02_FULL_34_9 TaxID=1802206 RepID=A0A1G2I3D4_9BACT|nr:MAG: hypothetical protein A3D35_03000 [Candidatus Staskawiczbacteria bacterium RIFCSPHIGHO2_02_FULL_34_9]
MAILFKQSNSKERLFTWVVILFSIIFLFSFSFFIFPPLDNFSSQQGEIFGQYDVKIDLGLLDSDKVKNLNLFSEEIKLEFTFTAKDKNGKSVAGNIMAIDKNEAESILKDKEFTVLSIDEYQAVNGDPFSPYYGSK